MKEDLENIKQHAEAGIRRHEPELIEMALVEAVLALADRIDALSYVYVKADGTTNGKRVLGVENPQTKFHGGAA